MTADDPLARIRRRWRVVAALCVVATLAGVGYYLFAPSRYEATLSVVPAPRKSTGVVTSKTAGLASLGLGGLSDAASSYRINAVLTSHSVARTVIDKLHLLDAFEVHHVEDAEKQLWKRCAATVDKESDMVTVTCTTSSPELSRDLAHEIGAIGAQVFTRLSTGTASEQRAYLEAQVDDARTRLENVSRSLAEFEEAHHIVDAAEQAKAVVGVIASLQGERISKQLQLAYIEGFATSHEASAAQLHSELRIIDAKLHDLVERSGTHEAGVFPPALEIPETRYQLEQLMRERKVQEASYLVLVERLEIAKADEIQNASVFQILDDPELPTYRSWPRAIVILLAAFAGLIAGILLVVIPPWWRALSARIRDEAQP